MRWCTIKHFILAVTLSSCGLSEEGQDASSGAAFKDEPQQQTYLATSSMSGKRPRSDGTSAAGQPPRRVRRLHGLGSYAASRGKYSGKVTEINHVPPAVWWEQKSKQYGVLQAGKVQRLTRSGAPAYPMDKRAHRRALSTGFNKPYIAKLLLLHSPPKDSHSTLTGLAAVLDTEIQDQLRVLQSAARPHAAAAFTVAERDNILTMLAHTYVNIRRLDAMGVVQGRSMTRSEYLNLARSVARQCVTPLDDRALKAQLNTLEAKVGAHHATFPTDLTPMPGTTPRRPSGAAAVAGDPSIVGRILFQSPGGT